MLGFFRRRMKLILWILVIAVIVTFLPWGIGVRWRSLGSESRAAGELFGKNVSHAEFEDSYLSILTDSYLHRRNLTEEQVKKAAWDRLILLAKAREAGIPVSDAELARTIRSLFGADGGFNQRLYENILRSTGTIPEQYERWTRENLMITRLVNIVRQASWLPEGEIKRRLRDEETKISIQYALFAAADFEKSAPVSDDEVAGYYSEHAADFKTPMTVTARYILIPWIEEKKDPAVTDDEIAEYYNAHPEEFSQGKGTKPIDEVRDSVRKRLLNEKKSRAVEEAKGYAYSRAVDVSLSLVSTANPDEVAKKYSLEMRQIGPFSRDDSIKEVGGSPAFTKAAFETEAGVFSDIVELPGKGYCIVFPVKKSDEATKPLDSVRDEIVRTLKGKKARRNAQETAALRRVEVEKKMAGEKLDFAAACRKLSIKTKESAPFTPRGQIPGLGFSTAVASAALRLPTGALSEVYEIGSGSCFFTVTKKEEPSEKELAPRLESFRGRAMLAEGARAFTEWNSWAHRQARHVDHTLSRQPMEEAAEPEE